MSLTNWVSPKIAGERFHEIVARTLGEQDVLQGLNEDRLHAYYRAYNDFTQAVARMRDWWWLFSHDYFATKLSLKEYTLRDQAIGEITISGVVVNAQTVTINSRVYEFCTDGAIGVGSHVAVTMSASDLTAATARTALINAINADTTAEVYAFDADESDTKIQIYWCGNDGLTKTYVTSGNNLLPAAATTMVRHLADFGRVRNVLWQGHNPLPPVTATDMLIKLGTDVAGVPERYVLTGDAKMQLLSYGNGAPNGIYFMELAYDRLPSGLWADGSGVFDWPEAFSMIPIAGVIEMLHANSSDPDIGLKNSYVQKALNEMVRYGNQSLDPDDGWDLVGGRTTGGSISHRVETYIDA